MGDKKHNGILARGIIYEQEQQESKEDGDEKGDDNTEGREEGGQRCAKGRQAIRQSDGDGGGYGAQEYRAPLKSPILMSTPVGRLFQDKWLKDRLEEHVKMIGKYACKGKALLAPALPDVGHLFVSRGGVLIFISPTHEYVKVKFSFVTGDDIVVGVNVWLESDTVEDSEKTINKLIGDYRQMVALGARGFIRH
jgi:hypothetical protein